MKPWLIIKTWEAMMSDTELCSLEGCDGELEKIGPVYFCKNPSCKSWIDGKRTSVLTRGEAKVFTGYLFDARMVFAESALTLMPRGEPKTPEENLLDSISEGLCQIAKVVLDRRHGGNFGGNEGHGAEFENAVFVMHPYCWCDGEDCGLCDGEVPNFLHKPSGFKAWWYKYIPRDLEVSRGDCSWGEVFKSCMESLNGV